MKNYRICKNASSQKMTENGIFYMVFNNRNTNFMKKLLNENDSCLEYKKKIGSSIFHRKPLKLDKMSKFIFSNYV